MSTRDFRAAPSVAGFLACEAFISLICGPVGSTKTTAGIMKILYHAAKMAPCTDGIRRSRAIWIRNTREQLADTSIPDVLKWLPDGEAGIFVRTERKFIIKFNDVECELLFRGLDDANDVRRLLSLQASFAIMDEFREIHSAVFEAVQGRLGRYPDKLLVPPRIEWGVDERGHPVGGCVTDDGRSNAHIWGMSNPPDLETFWEQYLSNPPKNARVFMQPSGMSPEADWLQFLPSGYYENLTEGKNEDWVDVYVHAKFGKSLAGSPVHRGYNRDFHVAKQPLNYIKSDVYPLIVGLDFGLTPAAAICQLDPRGRLLVLGDAVSDGMGILRFSREKLKPLLAQRFPGAKALIIGDPAGVQRAQTDERSVYDVLRAEGFVAVPARTNSIVARIASVDSFLAGQIDGGPRMIICPTAANIISALRGGYRYRRKRDGVLEESPEKNEHSHIADATQYACLHADGGNTFGWSVAPKRREVIRVSAAGWT